MAILCKPAIAVPEYIITMEQTLELCQQIHAGHPQLDLALRLLQNTGIRKRHIVLPVDEVLQHRGFEERNSTYEEQSKRRTPPVIFQALKNAGVTAKDIDVIIYVSCTGFMMPSMTAWLINNLGFRYDTKQIPIAQLDERASGGTSSRLRRAYVAAHF
jgi:1,3,6,8-tetrahydroxynaphthalene synthase